MNFKNNNWTREERYQLYNQYSADYLPNLAALAKKSPWRAHYHIEPDTGLLNDPNAFSYFNGKWHLFYQHFPFGPVHGLKSWSHLTSDDLVHFVTDDLQLMPDTELDNKGAYSGSAREFDDGMLHIFYTGNHRNAEDKRIPYQLEATLSENGKLVKSNLPIIFPPFDEVTEHFRDPQIFKFNSEFYLLIGAQNLDLQGIAKLYKKSDTAWLELGDLRFSDAQMGYMIECPNLVFIDNQPILIFCPQGLDKTIVNYDSIYPNTVVIGEQFDPVTVKIINPSNLTNLDEGFDCYATQAFNSDDGRVLAISWLGLPDTTYATDDFGYQGALSLVKEMTLHEGKLYQNPVDAIKTLRESEIHLLLNKNGFVTENCYELEISNLTENQLLQILADSNRQAALEIKIDCKKKRVKLIRGEDNREFTVKSDKIRLFIDRSIFELFINDGEKVASGRVFPNENQNLIFSENPLKASYYPLKNAHKIK